VESIAIPVRIARFKVPHAVGIVGEKLLSGPDDARALATTMYEVVRRHAIH
jgi:hypothetical protein